MKLDSDCGVDAYRYDAAPRFNSKTKNLFNPHIACRNAINYYKHSRCASAKAAVPSYEKSPHVWINGIFPCHSFSGDGLEVVYR